MDLEPLPGDLPTDQRFTDAGRVARLQPDRTADWLVVVIEGAGPRAVCWLQEQVVTGLCDVSDNAFLTLQMDMSGVIHTDQQWQAGLVERAYLLLVEDFYQAGQIGSSQRSLNIILPVPGLTLRV